MTFDKINDKLYAVREDGQEDNVLYHLFDQWNDTNYLYGFFKNHIDTLNNYFHIDSIKQAVTDTLEDAAYLEDVLIDLNVDNLNTIFKHLSLEDSNVMFLSRHKARNWNRSNHNSWLRIYALKLEDGIYIITGGAIKMTKKMQDDIITEEQLNKINNCRRFLKHEQICDVPGFEELINTI